MYNNRKTPENGQRLRIGNYMKDGSDRKWYSAILPLASTKEIQT